MTKGPLTGEMLIPEVVSCYPATREVFDRYGLKGCGGPLGPKETVAFFAAVHKVPLETLLQELNSAAKSPAPAAGAPVYAEGLADILYRRFFVAGILTVLTVGCTMGAVNLLTIAGNRTFTSFALLPWIWAHGHAMVFGWLGFFVMGFAYQAFPRFKYTTLWRPRLASLSFVLLAAGIALRVVAEPLAYSGPFVALGLLAGGLEIAAVVLFAVIIARTLAQGERGPELYDKFIYASLGWFIAQALLDPIAFYLTATASSPEALVPRIAALFGPLREMQLLGFAGTMVLGVSQRLFPTAYGAPEPSRRTSAALFWMWNGGVAANIVFYTLVRMTHAPAYGLALAGVYLVHLAAAVLLVAALRPFRASPRDRSLKFLQAAFVWLVIAMTLQAIFPFYNRWTGQAFSHAFFGAYRHAFTVGFLSLMILGISSKVAPILAGADLERLRGLLPTFVLLNVGNVLRISMEIFTDHAGWAYPVMGASGLLEVTGLGLWGWDLWQTVAAGRARVRELAGQGGLGVVPGEGAGPSRPEAVPVERLGSAAVQADMKVAEILDLGPRAEEVLVSFGFKDVMNPVLRRTMARTVTIGMACRIHGVNLEELLAALRERLGIPPPDGGRPVGATGRTGGR